MSMFQLLRTCLEYVGNISKIIVLKGQQMNLKHNTIYRTLSVCMSITRSGFNDGISFAAFALSILLVILNLAIIRGQEHLPIIVFLLIVYTNLTISAILHFMISFASKLNERMGDLLIKFRRCAAVLENKNKKLMMRLIKSLLKLIIYKSFF
jgi:hypothetical protein